MKFFSILFLLSLISSTISYAESVNDNAAKLKGFKVTCTCVWDYEKARGTPGNTLDAANITEANQICSQMGAKQGAEKAINHRLNNCVEK
jgi:hypothetical protein